ncbi:MAG: flagellar biosynthesis protein FlhB [Cellulosilyticaceae bacterium]
MRTQHKRSRSTSSVLGQWDLQFFSAESEGRTEKATGKKREDARKKGQVAKSTELNTAFILLTFFGLISVLAVYYLNRLGAQINSVFKEIPNLVKDFNGENLLRVVGQALGEIVIINGPLWLGLFAVALFISIIQVGYKPTFQPLAPKFSKLNPLSGLKRIVSKDMLVELIKGIGKVIFLGAIFLSVLQDVMYVFFKFYDMTLLQILTNTGEVLLQVGFKVGMAFLFLAILDYAYQKYKYEDSIKMTKQEIKDEYKQAEGDPQLKGKIKQKMREMSMKRMMQDIPKADVIITNPTHFAIAISYDSDKNSAPIVLAKGVDYVAQKIKEKGKEHHIHIVENKPLARALYYTVDIGEAIPEELYNAVAEVLAYVYSLNHPKK